MKKLILSLSLITFILTSCKKEEQIKPLDKNIYVTYTITADSPFNSGTDPKTANNYSFTYDANDALAIDTYMSAPRKVWAYTYIVHNGKRGDLFTLKGGQQMAEGGKMHIAM